MSDNQGHEAWSGGADGTYDVVVIGGGPVGEIVADSPVQESLSAVVVEAELLGGECHYWACIPSKALLRSGQVLRAAQAMPGAREAVAGLLDASAVLQRRDAFVSGYDDSSGVRQLEDAGIDFVRGHGRLAGERRVEVTDANGGVRVLVARQAVVVATGSAAVVSPIAGLAAAWPWTNREGTSAKRAPKRLAVLGGGAVAAELATAWRDLGSEQVVVIEHGDRLLKRMEPFASDAVAAGLRGRGIELRLSTSVVGVERAAPGGPVTLMLDTGEELVADELLLAAGRRPRTDDLGVETVGLEPGALLDVDDSGRVGGIEGGWLYAAGDVNGRALLTHNGMYQARAIGDAIAARAGGRLGDTAAPWGRYTATADHAVVPQVVFSDPQVAAVGLTGQQARDAGLTVRTADVLLESTSGAELSGDDVKGTARIVVDADRQVLVGATFVGPDVADLLHAATIAVVGEVPIARLWHAIPTFPTVSEVWLSLLEAYGRDSASLPEEVQLQKPAVRPSDVSIATTSE